METAAGAVEVLPVRRQPLLLLTAGSVAVAAFIFACAYLRLSGVFSKMLFDPGLDALILATVGIFVLALPVLRAREIYLGYSAVLSDGGVQVPGYLHDGSIRWSEVVAVEIQDEPKPAIFLWRRQPARHQRLYSTRGRSSFHSSSPAYPPKRRWHE